MGKRGNKTWERWCDGVVERVGEKWKEWKGRKMKKWVTSNINLDTLF